MDQATGTDLRVAFKPNAVAPVATIRNLPHPEMPQYLDLVYDYLRLLVQNYKIKPKDHRFCFEGHDDWAPLRNIEPIKAINDEGDE
ncbi:hypothetical protein TKK_0007645 [Trichogramma kaykai]